MIQTIKDSELVKRSIQRKWSLDEFLEGASQREDSNQQVKDKEDFKVSKVEYQSKDLSKGSTWGKRRHLKKKPPRAPGKWDHKKGKEEKGKSCGYCGKTGKTPSRTKLPSIRTTVFEVWQVQPLCIMLQNRYPKPREKVEGDQERENQENNRA